MGNRKWKKTKAHKIISTQQGIKKQQKLIDKLYKKIKVKIVENPAELAIETYINMHPHQSIKAINNDKFLLRITINYIRHCLSNYENLIQRVSKLNCTATSCQEFKKYVNQIIMQKYSDKLMKTNPCFSLSV